MLVSVVDGSCAVSHQTLHERIQGNWPAVEGIRIVRERKEVGDVGK
jgi:hypothetical protein